MVTILLRWILNALVLMLISYLIPSIEVESFYAALIAVLVLSIVNALIRPILLLLTLPINILTLGLFTLVINGLMFWFVASFIKGFNIPDFSTAFMGALIYSLISVVINYFDKNAFRD